MTNEEVNYIKTLQYQISQLSLQINTLNNTVNTLQNEKQYLLNYIIQLKDIIEYLNTEKEEAESKFNLHTDFFN